MFVPFFFSENGFPGTPKHWYCFLSLQRISKHQQCGVLLWQVRVLLIFFPPLLNRDAYDCVRSSLWVCPWAIKRQRLALCRKDNGRRKVSRKCRVGWRMNKKTKLQLLCVQVKYSSWISRSPACLLTNWAKENGRSLGLQSANQQHTLPTDSDTQGLYFSVMLTSLNTPVPKMHWNIETPVIPGQKTSACTGLVQTAAVAAHI